MATTYQFAFGHPAGFELVVDLEAETRDGAVKAMRALATRMSENEDPYIIDVGDKAYARVWVPIDPQSITEDCITDVYTWEAHA